MNPSHPAHTRRTRDIIIVIACIIALLIAGGIVYALINNKNTASNSTADDSQLYQEGENIPEPPAKSERTVNATIEDTDTGATITATKIVINPFALPKLYAVSDPARTVVLVEYTATNNGQYTGAPSGTKVKLVTANGTALESEKLSDGEMAAANYPEMSEIGPKVGSSTTGYVAYLVPTEQASGDFSLQYTRPKTTVVYGDDLPERTFEVKL